MDSHGDSVASFSSSTIEGGVCGWTTSLMISAGVSHVSKGKVSDRFERRFLVYYWASVWNRFRGLLVLRLAISFSGQVCSKVPYPAVVED